MAQPCPRCGMLHPPERPCLQLTLPGGSAPDLLAPGTPLDGGYRIVRALHRGGMGVLYLAEDLRRGGAAVAIKESRMPPEEGAAERREAEAWFAREASLLATLRSPLVPAFHGAFRAGAHDYLVQEYVEGEDLDALVRRAGPVAERTAIDWGMALCGLLGRLHTAPEPIVFCDLKPANVMVRAADRRLAVVDFGIARPSREVAGAAVGTPGYAPPEQYRGQVTPRSDLYALGATLHRLLSGHDPEIQEPFSFPPLQELSPQVSPALAAAIERALRPDPAERFASAEAMATALHEASLHPLGPLEALLSPWEDQRPARPRRSGLWRRTP